MKKRSIIQDLHNDVSLKKSFFQPKLSINEPGDTYEKEADAMADRVMAMKTSCNENGSLQRKENNAEETISNPAQENYLTNFNSSGQSLPGEVRNFYEPRFGYDFNDVKVHTDNAAARSAESINALAYTSGKNIVFNEGQYSPNTDGGKRLLGHELTHVVQQSNSEAAIQRDVKPRAVEPTFKNKCTWGDYTFEETEIKGIKLMVGMDTTKLPAMSLLTAIATQIAEDNKAITDPAFQVKMCVISPNTTRFALLNGQPVLMLDPINADVATTRHEMGHAIAHFLLHNKTYKIKGKVDSSAWLATLTDIFLQLHAITIKNIKGDEMFANFIVDPTEWSPGAKAEHPGDIDEFFASTKEAFQTNKKALAGVFVKYAKQNSKIGDLGKQLLQLLEFLVGTRQFSEAKTVSSSKDIESEISSLGEPSKVEDTMSAHMLTEMLLDTSKRRNCK